MDQGSKSISSNFSLRIDNNNNLLEFLFTKFPCDQPMSQSASFFKYCENKSLNAIIEIPFSELLSELDFKKEEDEFFANVEWNALRAVISQYLGIRKDDVDNDRCLIESIHHNEETTIVDGILLPPKEIHKTS